MKIAQVGSTQTNFKNNGIIAKKGAAKQLMEMMPALGERISNGLIRDDLPNHDYFLFIPGEATLSIWVNSVLNNRLCMFEKAVGYSGSKEKLTMEQLISLSK